MIIIDDVVESRPTTEELTKFMESPLGKELYKNVFIWQGEWHKEDFLDLILKKDD